MSMQRQAEVQGELVVTWAEMPHSPGHVFYDRLQKLLAEAGFDGFVETTCKPFYAPRMGAPSVPPGRYLWVRRPRNAPRSRLPRVTLMAKVCKIASNNAPPPAMGREDALD